MMPTKVDELIPVPPPAYHRAQARQAGLHIDAVRLVTSLHLLALCRVAVRLAHWHCPPPLPAGPGGAPRRYSEESLLLIALLRTLWRLSYQDMHDWLQAWPALAQVCGLPLKREGQFWIPSPSQHCKRSQAAGAPVHESLFVLTMLLAIRRSLIGAHDLIIDSAHILAWRRTDPDAAQLIIHVPFYAATGSIRCCAEGRGCTSSICSLQPMCTMPPSLSLCWHGRFSSSTFVLASSV